MHGYRAKEYKQEQLTLDIKKYNVDICCLQETKIKKDEQTEIDGSRIINFNTNVKDYGNGFVITKKWKESIYKYWKVSDRICVLQLKTNSEEVVEYHREGREIPTRSTRIIQKFEQTMQRDGKFINVSNYNRRRF